MTTDLTISRRTLLGAAGASSAALLLPTVASAAPAGPPPPTARGPLRLGALGANYNGSSYLLDPDLVRRAGANWVRAFVTVSWLDRVSDAANDRTVNALLRAHEDGLRVVMSLKFDMTDKDIPAPGSPGAEVWIRRLNKLLPKVLNKVDILVIGNEPFRDTKQEQRDGRLNAFHEAMAAHVIATRRRLFGDSSRTHLYMGALNGLQNQGQRTATVARWLDYVRRTPEIEGVDLHPHLMHAREAQAFLDYTLPRIRREQTFLALEFSTTWWWQEHLRAPIPASFARRYNIRRDLQVWELVDRALRDPFPRAQWIDFLRSADWFVAEQNQLADQMKIFRDSGRLAVATYALTQQTGVPWGPDTDPWILNGVFANATVENNRRGLIRWNVWFPQFRALAQRTA